MIVNLSQVFIPCISGTLVASLILGIYVWKKSKGRGLPEAKHRIYTENVKLSPRQMIVWELIAKGAGNKEIGMKLNISEQTVKNYCYEIYHSLGVKNRVEASLKFSEFNKGRWCKLQPSLFCQEGYCLECEIARRIFQKALDVTTKPPPGSG